MSSKITQAGFINLQERTYKTPLGEWSNDPKLQELGKWNLLQFDVGLEGFATQLLTNVMGVSRSYYMKLQKVDKLSFEF